MATATLVIREKIRSNVAFLRLAHNGKERSISIAKLHKEDIKRNNKGVWVWKNKQKERLVRNIMDGAEDMIIKIGVQIRTMNIDDIMRLITQGQLTETDSFHLDFLEYYDKQVEKLIKDGRTGTASIRVQAIKKFKEWYGKQTLDVNEMSNQKMQQFVDDMAESGVSTQTMTMYIANLKVVYNQCSTEYNEEDVGIIRVVRKPFEKIVIPKVETTKRVKVSTRPLSVDTMRFLYNLDLEEGSKACFGRDVFLMSFMLCGMNSADMYNVEKADDMNRLFYTRRKTKNRSKDESAVTIRLTIPKQASEINERLRAKRGEYQWQFERTFLNHKAFTANLNYCLSLMVETARKMYAEQHGVSIEKAEEVLQLEGLHFYTARYSWASIAANNCDLTTDIIDRCLCHSGKNMAERSYIKKDYDREDRANKSVCDYTFGVK